MKIIPADGPDGIETVRVFIAGSKKAMLVNLCDFDAATMTPADAEPPADVTVPTGMATPMYHVGKIGRSAKFFIKNLDGSKAAADGIDTDGYLSETDAWEAIRALA